MMPKSRCCEPADCCTESCCTSKDATTEQPKTEVRACCSPEADQHKAEDTCCCC